MLPRPDGAVAAARGAILIPGLNETRQEESLTWRKELWQDADRAAAIQLLHYLGSCLCSVVDQALLSFDYFCAQSAFGLLHLLLGHLFDGFLYWHMLFLRDAMRVAVIGCSNILQIV